jgi:hypothetical protein
MTHPGGRQRNSPLVNGKRTAADFSGSDIFAAMKLQFKHSVSLLGIMSVFAFAPATSAGNPTAPTPTANTPVIPDTRYGLFNGLDHRSSYGQGVFPEPFLVDDSDLEVNEARLDWVHTEANDSKGDEVTAEVERGFGLLTLEAEFHFERGVDVGDVSQGIGNIDLGARYPFYQFVPANGFFDTTFGAAIEVGIPVNSAVSKNFEFVPKIFNDTKLGEHFTIQSIFGYSTFSGGGEEGGAQTFEYGFDFGYTIPHSQLPLPGVQQFIPIFELAGETALNNGESGRNSVLGNLGFRLNLTTIGRVQPRLGLGFIFPINHNGRDDAHWGIVTSLVFEY